MLSPPQPIARLTQPSLFGQGEPSINPELGHASRLRLSRGAWVDHLPGWLDGHDTIFERMMDTISWQQKSRSMYDRIVDEPRLTYSFDTSQESGNNHYPQGLEVIQEMLDSLNQHYDYEFSTVSLNLYRDGTDSVAWHGDQVARHRLTALVATVSVGEPRPFRLRPKSGGASHTLLLGHGDLTVMGGTCQRTWEHCVPKVAKAGPRIVIMFRPRWVS